MPERNFDASALTEGDRPNETEDVHTVRLCRNLRYFLPEQTLQADTLQQTLWGLGGNIDALGRSFCSCFKSGSPWEERGHVRRVSTPEISSKLVISLTAYSLRAFQAARTVKMH
jgi:hypothetical protein